MKGSDAESCIWEIETELNMQISFKLLADFIHVRKGESEEKVYGINTDITIYHYY